MKPTYKEQFDKLTRAYIKGEVNPMMSCNCFVGNLLNNTDDWSACRHFNDGNIVPASPAGFTMGNFRAAISSIEETSGGLYDQSDIVALERNFIGILLSKIYTHEDLSCFFTPLPFLGGCACTSCKQKKDHRVLLQPHVEELEDLLFEAFASTLDLLREIHEEKGEVIEEVPAFTKRELVMA